MPSRLSSHRPLHVPRRLRPWLLLVGGLVLYLSMLGGRDVVTSHEARVVQTARQMAETWPWQGRTLEVAAVEVTDVNRAKRVTQLAGGETFRVNPWLVPVLSGKIRLQKPPLPNWCAAVLFRLFDFHERWARLVPALMAAVATLLIFDLARLLTGRVAAWVAALVWLGSYFVFDEYRKAMVDPYLAFFTLAAVWAYVKGSGFRVQGSGGNEDFSLNREPRTLNPHCLVFYLSLALGALCKAHLVFLHVGIALAAYHLCYRRKVPWGLGRHLLGAALMVAVAAPWFVYVLTRVPHAWEIFRHESLAEAGDEESARPWFFYALSVFQLSLPWTPLFILGVLLAFNRGRARKASPLRALLTADAETSPVTRSESAAGARLTYAPTPPPRAPSVVLRKDRRAWFPLVWYAAVFVAFTLFPQKKNAYLLPVVPAQTLLVTQGALLILAAARRRSFRGNPAAMAAVQAAIGVAVAVLIALSVAKASDGAGAAADGEDDGAALVASGGRWEAVGAGLAAGAVALVVSVAPVWPIFRRRPRTWLAGQAAAYAALVALYFNLAVTPRENRRSARPVAQAMLVLLREGGRTTRPESLPEHVAVYLPVELDREIDARYRFAEKVLAVVDDSRGVRARRRTNARYEDAPYPPQRFRQWLEDPTVTVTEVRRIPLPFAPGDAKWKLFELTVQRAGYARAEP